MVAKYVALLRGINVRGKNALSMTALRGHFEKAGCRNVRTYIQSGNVLFEAPPGVATALQAEIPKAILGGEGLTVPVVLRTLAELAAIVKGNPFAKEPDEKILAVAFLTTKPSPVQCAALDPNRSPGDTFDAREREIYMHCPSTLGRTKLTTAYFDRVLEQTTTIRNWATTKKLHALLSAEDA
jgi:uncharacterized protein (DUF1697 family)